MENPGYMQAAHIFQNNGLEISPGRLDEKGLAIDSISGQSRIAYVTPSHQYPLGAVMPFGRRKELLEWAGAHQGRYIIEDDHDSEFRYKGKPIPSLQGMDKNGRVIYIGTFSKAIAPAIRVGYMILPDSLFDIWRRVCGHYSCTVSRIDQEILARFLSEGYFEKHVNRMRKIYRGKHDLVLECTHPLLEQYHLRLHGEHAGLHVVMELPEDGIGEDVLLSNAEKIGIRLYGIGSHYLAKHSDGAKLKGILLGYSNLPEEDIREGIRLMTDAHIFRNT
jgi:GntR family transcriptional regulator/MocR family aminotransferase